MVVARFVPVPSLVRVTLAPLDHRSRGIGNDAGNGAGVDLSGEGKNAETWSELQLRVHCAEYSANAYRFMSSPSSLATCISAKPPTMTTSTFKTVDPREQRAPQIARLRYPRKIKLTA